MAMADLGIHTQLWRMGPCFPVTMHAGHLYVHTAEMASWLSCFIQKTMFDVACTQEKGQGQGETKRICSFAKQNRRPNPYWTRGEVT